MRTSVLAEESESDLSFVLPPQAAESLTFFRAKGGPLEGFEAVQAGLEAVQARLTKHPSCHKSHTAGYEGFFGW